MRAALTRAYEKLSSSTKQNIQPLEKLDKNPSETHQFSESPLKLLVDEKNSYSISLSPQIVLPEETESEEDFYDMPPPEIKELVDKKFMSD